MPVHNALPYLDEAIRSILDQSYANFEFVIYDDGSTDGSTERLRNWASRDERIKLHVGERNLGPAESSNRVVAQASARLIARMDADDVSHPDRLREQVALLHRRPEIGVVGTLCDIIDGSGRKLRGPDFWRLGRRSWFAPFPHGSITYRREIFDRLGGYRSACEFWEDQDLFLRMSPEARIVTIPRALYMHRHSQVSTRLVSDQERVERAVDLMYRSLDRLNEGRWYDYVLRVSRSRAGEAHKVDPRVFISLGSLTLWSGGRPRLFRRLLEHGLLRADLATASALVWTAWAALDPPSLRLFMKLLAGVRNAATGGQVRELECVEWKLPRPLATFAPGAAEERLLEGRA